jgi:hypothetical protein
VSEPTGWVTGCGSHLSNRSWGRKWRASEVSVTLLLFASCSFCLRLSGWALHCSCSHLGQDVSFFFFLFYFKGSGMTPSLTFVVIQQCWNVSPVVKHFCVSFGDSVFAIGIFFLYSLRCLYIYTIKYCHIYTLFLFSFPLSAQYLLHNFMPPTPTPSYSLKSITAA